MPNLIPLEEFENITNENVKLNILFSYVSDIYKNAQDESYRQIEICQQHWNNCNVKFDKLDKRKKFDTTTSGIMGVFGGILWWIGKTVGNTLFGK